MHSIDEKQIIVQQERAKVWEKKSALTVIKSDETNSKHRHCSFNLVDARQRDRFVESELLQDEINQLEEDLTKKERLLCDLNIKKEEHKEKLYTIGIDESDDVIDGFPDFTTHYENKRGSKTQRAR